MELKELRIGNLFMNLQGGIQEVTIETLEYLSNDKMKPHQAVRPILISDKWVERFGFVKKSADWEIQADNEGTKIWINLYDNSFYVGIPYEANGTNLKIKYVHQLTNLFFALTGNELKLN